MTQKYEFSITKNDYEKEREPTKQITFHLDLHGKDVILVATNKVGRIPWIILRIDGETGKLTRDTHMDRAGLPCEPGTTKIAIKQ